MSVLLGVLGGYASGTHSYRSLAQELNAQGLRTASGKPFTESSISTILNNRFYEGKVVYHRGSGDEAIIEGVHEVPEEVRRLWLRCQDMRRSRKDPGQPSPTARQQRIYPLTGVLVCDGCGEPYHGIGSQSRGRISLRMMHGWHRCDLLPQSVSAPLVEEEIARRVLGCVSLDLLRDLPALWQHPGVTPEQRRDLAREVFEEVRLREGQLVAVKPRPQYVPLFAFSLWKQHQVAGGDRSP